MPLPHHEAQPSPALLVLCHLTQCIPYNLISRGAGNLLAELLPLPQHLLGIQVQINSLKLLRPEEFRLLNFYNRKHLSEGLKETNEKYCKRGSESTFLTLKCINK